MTNYNNYTTLRSNDLEEVHMIAGDWQEFEYDVYDIEEATLDLTDADCSVLIIKYGDPSYVLVTLEGDYTGSPINRFTASFPSGSSINLSGVYQQIPRVTFPDGKTYNPSQGKIVIYPSPEI